MIAAFDPVQQAYLLEARQMQALSFAVHIPLVCFGIAFPAMVLRAEWLWMRTGDEVYRVLAMRWTKVMVALFACGVVTGTILSFEMGLLWPGFMGTFGAVFGLGFALEGFSFFVEAIFIGIYVYGWNRLSPRAHFASGIPIVLAGLTGSLFVMSVNSWMNDPGGFTLRGGASPTSIRSRRCSATATSATSSCTCTSRASSSPASSSRRPMRSAPARALGTLRADRADDPADGRGARGAGAAARRRLGGARGRQDAADEARRARGRRPHPARRAAAPARLVSRRRGEGRDPGPEGALAAGLPRPDAEVQGLDAVPEADRPPVNVVRIAFQLMVVDRDVPRGAERVVPVRARAATSARRRAPGSTGARGRRPGVGRRADQRAG